MSVSENYEHIVIGLGHAGCEAALSTARMGFKTLGLTLNFEAIALMACNPSVGGTAKGQLVREIDALGGEMGLNADQTLIQMKMLNTSKGPAVRSLRAQADKYAYQRRMRQVLEAEPFLDIRQAEVVSLEPLEDGGWDVLTRTGTRYSGRCVTLCTGVYLKSRIIIGEFSMESGPSGLFPATALSASLIKLGFTLQRFKTGTPCRIDAKYVDLSRFEPQSGDETIVPFSFLSPALDIPQMPCYLGYTNSETHRVIRENLHRSPLYTGEIKGVGPRYCPSIESKVVNFADKERHQIFLEPEGRHTREFYVQGMSSSLPEAVQAQMLRTIDGLENARITRCGYAIEYDCIDPTQLTLSLASKNYPNLFFAGQINGSSGYEEAAAQGLLAGINAALYLRKQPALTLLRSQAYLGVLVDDLVLKGTAEPYRMMTSRTEHRLLLRQDNADLRLTELSYRLGLADENRYLKMCDKKEQTETALQKLQQSHIPPLEQVQKYLQNKEMPALPDNGINAYDLLKRPEISYDDLRNLAPELPALAPAVEEQVDISVHYEGYIKRALQQIEQQKRLEGKQFPPDINFTAIGGLRLEARQKLQKLRPLTIGQASRISGISPADIAVLLVYLKRYQEAPHA